MIKLHNILKDVEILEIKNGKVEEINKIAYHTDKVLSGDIFVCIPGYKVDGHDFLKKAKDKGAKVAIVEKFVNSVEIPQYKVKNSRITLAKMASNFYNEPSTKLLMTGVTATNGKTTTAYMIDSIVSQKNITGLIGTVGVKIDKKITPAILTTPESLDLQKDLFDMVEKDCKYATMEVSSSAQELYRNAFIDYDVVTLNNISREHIDNHGSFEKYIHYKSRLVRHASPETYVVLNMDDENSKNLINKTKGKVITYGIDSDEGFLKVSNIDMSTGFPKFDISINKSFQGYEGLIEPTNFSIDLNVTGYHSVCNAIVAVTVALIYGFSIDEIKEGLRIFKGIERRFELIYNDEFMVIDDHFANPGNINVTLKTLEFLNYNNLNILYALRGSRGVVTTKENSEMMVKWFKKLGLDEVFVTKSINHVKEKDKVLKDELEVFCNVMNKNNIKVHLYDDLEESISSVLGFVKENDLLLLAGCQGMDYGCNILLNHLEKKYPSKNKKELFKPLETRVAGLLKNL